MKEYITQQQAADMIGVKLTCLRNWRCKNLHLPFYKPSAKMVLYRESEVIAYIESTRKPVSMDIYGGIR